MYLLAQKITFPDTSKHHISHNTTTQLDVEMKKCGKKVFKDEIEPFRTYINKKVDVN